MFESRVSITFSRLRWDNLNFLLVLSLESQVEQKKPNLMPFNSIIVGILLIGVQTINFFS